MGDSGGEITVGPPPGDVFIRPWRCVFPALAALYVYVRRGDFGIIRVIPEVKQRKPTDPDLKPLEFYTKLPEQSFAFESATLEAQLHGSVALSNDMKVYAAKLESAVPEWQARVDETLALLQKALQLSVQLNRDINIKLGSDGKLPGGDGKSVSEQPEQGYGGD